jgi:hypothetical protein
VFIHVFKSPYPFFVGAFTYMFSFLLYKVPGMGVPDTGFDGKAGGLGVLHKEFNVFTGVGFKRLL